MQVFPSLANMNPVKHSQRKVPGWLLQTELDPQIQDVSLHSSTSVNKTTTFTDMMWGGRAQGSGSGVGLRGRAQGSRCNACLCYRGSSVRLQWSRRHIHKWTGAPRPVGTQRWCRSRVGRWNTDSAPGDCLWENRHNNKRNYTFNICLCFQWCFLLLMFINKW